MRGCVHAWLILVLSLNIFAQVDIILLILLLLRIKYLPQGDILGVKGGVLLFVGGTAALSFVSENVICLIYATL